MKKWTKVIMWVLLVGFLLNASGCCLLYKAITGKDCPIYKKLFGKKAPVENTTSIK